MRHLTHLDLFSGIGGFSLGLEATGRIKTVAFVESDKFARRVLHKHWPDVPVIHDVRDVKGDDFNGVDIITGGFPCQDVSVAGRREGLSGDRSGLWFEFERILSECRPRWAIIENVPGLLTSNNGEDFATILRGLGNIGYNAAWRVLDSQYFGVPNDADESLLSDILEVVVPVKYYLSQKAAEGLLRRANKKGVELSEEMEIALSYLVRNGRDKLYHLIHGTTGTMGT